MKKVPIPVWSLALIVALAAHVQGEAHRISAEEIAGYLQLNAESAEINVPDVVSRVARPSLRLLAQERHGNATRLRLGCANRDCLPFYAQVRFGSEVQAELFCERTHADLAYRRAAKIVHGGSTAKLEIQVRGIRLQLYVKCLQSGAEGEVIRARDEVTKRVYLARVVGRDHLRCEL